MDERQIKDDTVAGLFSHIMMLRKDLELIGDSTTDANTKMQVRHALQKSLAMPPETKWTIEPD